jgi:hypothetical protein
LGLIKYLTTVVIYMLWLGHIFLSRLYFGSLTLKDVIWSIAPDIPMALILSQWNISWTDMKNTNIYMILYKVPHSFLSITCVPTKYRKIYALHILLDILSHTGEWSIQPFFPCNITIHGIWDPVQW